MPLKDTKFLRNESFLKIVGCEGHKKIVLTYLPSVRNKGIEVDHKSCFVSLTPSPSADEGEERLKLDNNIYRAKRNIKELALCNPWDFFCTMTIDSEKHDRSDLNGFFKKLRKYINNIAYKHNTTISYLFIPELHKDGLNWHLHGFIKGLPLQYLKCFKVGDRMGSTLAKKVLRGDTVYNWVGYSERFGFCDLEPIKDALRVSSYVTKYISKDVFKSVKNLNAHTYYCSNGLKRAELVKRGFFFGKISSYDFENDFCKIKSFNYSDEMLEHLKSQFS